MVVCRWSEDEVDEGESAMGTVASPQAGKASGDAAGHTDAEKAPAVATQEVFGFEFVDDRDVSATVDRILGPQPDDGRLPVAVTPNVDDIVQLHEPEHAALLSTLRRSRYVLPDGQPIVWASRLLGRPLTARLPGSTLVPPLWRRAAAERLPVVVLVSSEDIAGRLRAEHPDVRGIVPPFFDAGDTAVIDELIAQLVDDVIDTGARLVFFGINFPKQQRVALGLLDRLAALDDAPAPVLLLIGGSFNMYFGVTPRAPEWMQRWGLEWLYRFILEPRRLFRRYFVTDVKFLPIALRELRQHRRRRAARKEHP